MAITITSLHHVTATVADAQEDLDFYTKLLGLRLVKQTVNFDNPGGIGTVHHVALAIPTEEQQRTLREEVRRRGLNVTEVRDRNYFRSIYFREPGGVLVDEEEAALGRALKLPAWEEPRRAEIEAALPSVAL